MALLSRPCAPSRRFVVLTTPRTGSQLLVELLNSHPDIRCESEILEQPRRAPILYLRGRAVQVATGSQAYGFKLMARHIISQPAFYPSLTGFVAALRAAGFDIVVLRRERTLDQALSWIAATQIGWHHHRGDGVRIDRLAVDPADLLFVLVLIEQQKAALEAAVEQVAHLAITYEDDLCDPASQQLTVDRVCEWIGVGHARVTSDLVRPATGGLAGLVADPVGLAAALRATRFAALADELG